MNKVEPIRDLEKLEEMKIQLKKTGYRNFLLFVIGINTGLRISDILNLKVKDVRGKSHIDIVEQKTGKRKKFLINDTVEEALRDYIKTMEDEEYLFQSQKGDNEPISRVQAYRILKEAALKVGLPEVGTHTLRKTFGYHYYSKTKDIALLMQLFNHSSERVCLRYIGVNQDILDEAIRKFSL